MDNASGAKACRQQYRQDLIGKLTRKTYERYTDRVFDAPLFLSNT
jgi:hypothetical protein